MGGRGGGYWLKRSIFSFHFKSRPSAFLRLEFRGREQILIQAKCQNKPHFIKKVEAYDKSSQSIPDFGQ